jgi:hypothetical protein
VTIVIDALGSRHRLDKEIAIERMEQAGTKLVTSEMLIFEWLQTSNRPEFKAILKIIK